MKHKPWLSILVPAYNEKNTIEKSLKRVLSTKFPFEFEMIIVDDGSTDGTSLIIDKIVRQKSRVQAKHLNKNLGKGQAVKIAKDLARGKFLVIHDADMEYHPRDLLRLASSVTGENSVVYGSRLQSPPVLFGPDKTALLLHYFGNRFLSLVTSILYSTWITDIETCYKMFPAKIAKELEIESKGFELEAELTAKILLKGLKIKEISITSRPRGYNEGKKLKTFRDGFKALGTLLKYRFFHD